MNNKRSNLICKRKKAGYSKPEFSKSLGLTLRQYQNYEDGTTNGSTPIWQAIARCLGESQEFLQKRDFDLASEHPLPET